METLTETTERILIREDVAQIERHTQEAQQRADLLNTILKHDLTNDELRTVCASSQSIEAFIHKRLLEENSEFKKLYDAGIKGIDAALSPELNALAFSLKAWYNLRPSTRQSSNYENLIFTDSWKIDHEALEKMLIRLQYKVYVSDERMNEYKEIETLCKILEKIQMPNHQVAEGYLARFIESVGRCKFIPKWQFFLNRD